MKEIGGYIELDIPPANAAREGCQAELRQKCAVVSGQSKKFHENMDALMNKGFLQRFGVTNIVHR